MIKLNVPNISCGHCASAINKAIASFDPAARVEVDVQQKTVSVETKENLHSLRETLEEAGYPATPA